MVTESSIKELPLSGCNVWFSPDVAPCKELKSIVECHGGKVCTRLSGKVNFVVAKRKTDDLTEKVSKYSLSVIPESFVRDSVKTNTPLHLFTSHHLDLQKENCPNQQPATPNTPIPSSPSLTSGLPFSPATSSAAFPASPPNHSRSSHGIRERLKGLSLKSKNKQKDSPSPSPSGSPNKTISKPPTASAQRTRMRNATRALCESLHIKKGEKESEKEQEAERERARERDREMQDEDVTTALQGIVFVVYGTFSMPREMLEQLIESHGGKYVPVINDQVTHVLFGGEDMCANEFVQAKERKIHIVNEYFLRLLIKY